MDFSERTLLKLDEMNKYLEQLEELLPSDFEEYIGDLKTKLACEKTIELAIEAVLDVIAMIISEKKLGLPKSEDDLILIVQRKGILSPGLARRIREMKGYRNILVHKYGELDDQKSYQSLSEELDDFAKFEQEIKKYLKSLDKKAPQFQKEVGKL